MMVPTALPCESVISTLVLAALGRAKAIRATAAASVGRVVCFRGIIAKAIACWHQGAMLDPQEGGVYFGKVLNLSWEAWTHGFECSGAGDGTGSGRRFSSAGREDLSHYRDVQSGATGAGHGGTRRRTGAAATGGA